MSINKIIREEYSKFINEGILINKFANLLSNNVKKFDAGFGEVVYNYQTDDGVEVTLKYDPDEVEINGQYVSGDIQIDYIGVDNNRGKGNASRELKRIINIADNNDLSLSVIVDPETATRNIVGDKTGKIGLSSNQLKSWLSNNGFIFSDESNYGYRPSKSEDKSKFQTKTIKLDINKIDVNDIEVHSSPYDFKEELSSGNIKDGLHENGNDVLYLVKNKTPYKVTNVGIKYNYKEKKYELFNK